MEPGVLPAIHDGNPERRRADRVGHRSRHRGEPAASLSQAAAVGGGGAAAGRERDQFGRRFERDGRGDGHADAGADPRLHSGLRAAVHAAGDLPQLRALCCGPQVHHAQLIRLRRGGVHGSYSVGRSDPLAIDPARRVDWGVRDRLCRNPRHHHQPLSLLLAGGAGDRGGEAPPRQAALRLSEGSRTGNEAHPAGHPGRHGVQQCLRGKPDRK